MKTAIRDVQLLLVSRSRVDGLDLTLVGNSLLSKGDQHEDSIESFWKPVTDVKIEPGAPDFNCLETKLGPIGNILP